jgi:hypothetical protein
MIRALLVVALGIGALTLALSPAFAADKEVTLEGKLVCAKCTLGEAKKCSHALKVTEKGKDVIYAVDDKNANHKEVCPAGTELEAKVTGIVVEKDGKKTITKAKVELKK